MPSHVSTQHLALLEEGQRSSSLAFISGFHALKHAVRFRAEILCVVTTNPAKLTDLASSLAPDISEFLEKHIELIEARQMKEIHPNRLHWTEVWAVAKKPVIDIPKLLSNSGRTSPLVVIEDPKNLGNLGASVRVCAALGASGTLSVGESDPWSPRSLQAASGLQFAIPTAKIDRLEDFSGDLIVFDPEGEELSQSQIPANALLLFGTERGGVTEGLVERATMKVRIPMRNGVSSLNLATSVAIALSHASFPKT